MSFCVFRKYDYQRQGFTLLELLLYVGLASTILSVTLLFAHTMLIGRVHTQAVAEVDAQGAAALALIVHTIRNAEGVIEPTIGTNSTILNLDVVPGANDPTQFYVANGVLYVSEGNPPQHTWPLTNDQVTVSDFLVTNLSRSNAPSVLHISFTVSRLNPTGVRTYDVARTFVGGAAIRDETI